MTLTDKIVSKRFIELIEAVCKREGINIVGYSKKAKVPHGSVTIARIRNGTYNPGISRLIELKKAFPYVIIGYCFGDTTLFFNDEWSQNPSPLNGHSKETKSKSKSYKR